MKVTFILLKTVSTVEKVFDFLITDVVKSQLKDASSRSPAVIERLEELKANPLGRANPTGISIIGEFYINAGNRWCILFDIDKTDLQTPAKVDIEQLSASLKQHVPVFSQFALPSKLT